MNWETYKTLPPELKSEYMFRFGKKPRVSGPGYFIAIALWLLSIAFLLMVNILYQTMPALINSGIDTSVIGQRAMSMSEFSFWILIIYIMYDYSGFIIFYAKEYWWRKKNHIKRQRGTIWKTTTS